MVTTVIQWLTATGALLGGIDLLFGNRLGIGSKFKEGLFLLGPTALSMAGIICLCPLIGDLLGIVVVPLFRLIHLDPGLLGGVIAIDMGGYPLSMQLASDPHLGQFSGILASSTLGCTLSFTVPMALSLLETQHLDDFLLGLICGLIACPIGLFAGGALIGLPFSILIFQTFPFILLTILISLGLRFAEKRTFSTFHIMSKCIYVLAIIGLIAGIMKKMIGLPILARLASVDDAMALVSAIGLSLVGLLPLLELLLPLINRFSVRFRFQDFDSIGLTGLLVSIFTVTPAIPMLNRMNRRSRIMTSAFMVSSASLFSAHLAFTMTAAPELAGPLLITKVTGAFAGLLIAALVTGNSRKS